MEAFALDAVKFVDGSDDLIEGLAIPYGGPAYLGGKDFDGERFDAETDLHLEWFPTEGRPFLFGHGLDPEIKTAVVGRQIERKAMDVGQWVRVQLDKRSAYFGHIQKLVGADGLSFSSGAVPHLVQTDADGTIKSWPWVELSGTPTPSNPNASAYAVKAVDLVDHFSEAGLSLPAQLIASALKALDATTDPEAQADPSAFEAKASRVSVAVAELRDHARNSFEMRAKTGRALSAANRERITAALVSREAVLTAYADLEALLAETDPDAKSVDLSFLRDVAETVRRADDATVRI